LCHILGKKGNKEQIYGKCLITLSRFALLLALQLSAAVPVECVTQIILTENSNQFAQLSVICLLFDKSGPFAAPSNP
jgi:hypothetical protein